MAGLEFCLFLILLARVATVEHSASFYGESYIRVPMEDAQSSTQLHLHFKTHRPHGLLLLAAGSTDHFLVEIKAGMIEVRINLGSGEASVFSSPSVRLDDQQWHEVEVNRTNGSLELIVDGVTQGSAETPGSFHELNVQDGVLLGSLGTYSNAVHNHVRNFRGCMKDVLFNDVDILTAAKEMKNVQNAFEITWNCDTEFSAGSDVPVSFLSETSFVAFSHFHVREKGSFACDFKTRTENAIVLFNSGHGNFKDDFLSLEIIDGRPKLSVNSGSGVLEVVLMEPVNDGKWHELDLSISQSTVELRVDSSHNMTRFGGEESHINLAGHLFVGGLGLKARAHALRLGLKSVQEERSMKGSMLGCIRNIVINSRPYGFREVQVSRHIDSVCSWVFPCASEPCVDGAECVESGDKFRCICDQSVCTKDNPDRNNGLPEEDFEDMVAIVALSVKEGGEAVINTNAIDVIFDYRSYRIREIAVRFRVVLPPRFGRLEVDRGQRQSESFTLLDLLTSKVKYVHDGTDSQTDDITIEMSISGSSELPHQLKANYEFVLPIKIIPHNDPPKLLLPSGNQINVLGNSKLQITVAVVEVKDPDTKNKDLHYDVSFLRPAQSFFENYSEPEKPITTFSHQDILDGKIWFAHKEDAVIDIRMNVSDDSDLKDSVVLRFLAVPLNIKMERNTGLVVPYATTTFLQSGNLSATTNVPLQNLELRYRITKLPRFGQIQRIQHGTAEWTDVDTFTQRHLDNFRLRYNHFSSDFSASGDEFSFIVTAKETETAVQVFKVNFQSVSLTVANSNRLIIHQVPYAQMTNSSLLVTAKHGQIDTAKLIFILFRTPKHGAIYVTNDNRIFNPLDFDSLRPLESGGSFSQFDIDMGRVYFKFDSTGFERKEDYIDLTIKYPSSTGRMMRLWVEYIPLETAIRFTNNGLRDVTEGGQKVITRSNLYLEMDNYKEFQFSLIQLPIHGNISIVDPRTSSIMKHKVEEFRSADIREGRLVYIHDDSETDRDSFVFAAMPLFKSEDDMPDEIQEFTGTFHISMAMRNDNPPERLVDKVFHVVTNGKKKITIQDLAFTDPDIHYNTSNLQYRRHTIPNGEILVAKTNTPAYQFTQKDLEDENLVFQHKGSEFGRATIFVTDGQFYWTGVFEIQASEPYINVENNTGLSVYKGKTAVITHSNLSFETNMDFPPTSFSFIVTTDPTYGTLRNEGGDSSEFTYEDVLEGRVKYVHDGSNSEEDLFRFTVVRGDVQADGVFPIIIKDDDLLHPPQIIRNHMLEVDEGQIVQITDSHLLVQHPSLNDEEIVFIVTTLPKHGFLQLRGTPFSTNGPIQFSQGEISRGLVEYVQTESVVIDDQFIFDVDTDVQALKNLIFSIEITPSSLPVKPGNLSVTEGGSVVISMDTLKTVGSQYQTEKLIYEIVTIPTHGYILNSEKSNIYNMAFSSDSVMAGKIMYQHDNSESLNDSFTVIAFRADGSLKSEPLNIKVTVEPEDDQPPRVVVNKGLSVWADSVTLLTGKHLHAEDPDTSSDAIIFTISSPSNGHVSFLNNTFLEIFKFSQHDIDAGHVVFVHKGESTGYFSVQASDGKNSDIQRKFHVRAHPVVLQLRRSGPLLVFPTTIHPVSNATLLAAATSANFSRPIVFTIVEPKPRYGKIITMMAGKPLQIQSFTQEDVNTGKVFYQHTGSMQQWKQFDAIHLDVSTAYASPLRGEVCDVEIYFGNINFENKATLLGLHEASVREGGSVHISHVHLDSAELLQQLHTFQKDLSVTFRVVTLPRHGSLLLDGETVSRGDIFTQDDIDAERLRYYHDDSDTVHDAFAFDVEINQATKKGDEPIGSDHALNFSIEVEPVNDQRMQLVTKNPSLRVMQGGQIALTSANLLTIDPDTLASDIIYTVQSGPTNGKLVRYNHTSVQVETFTQQEVNDGALVFMQNGIRKNGEMFFKVTDGKFSTENKRLNLFVIPVNINVSRIKPVHLIQSESSVYLSRQFLNITTNGNRDDLLYNVVTKPHYGQILVRGGEAMYFSQEDVDTDSVLYVMLNLSVSEDSFQCHIKMKNMDVSVRHQTVDIIVKPLVSQVPLVVAAGATVPITKTNLDASELASRTGDNPTFKIISPPSHGQILRKLRKRRDLIAQPVLKPVEQFTFDDVLYAKIFYVSNASKNAESWIPDSFSYLLHASNAQPAFGKFLINLDESEDKGNADDDGMKTDQEYSPAVNPEVSHSEEGDDDSSAAMIVGIVLGVLLVFTIVVIVLVVLWRRHRLEEERYEANIRAHHKPRPYISGPLQLEQPHVHIEPQQCIPSPGSGDGQDDERCLMRHSSNLSALPVINVTHDMQETTSSHHPHSTPRSPDLSRVEVSSAVPDCKVTPLVEIKGDEEKPGSRSERGAVGDRQSGRSSASTDLYDWTLMDPELLQHCRTETPVLKGNQYWV